MQCILVKNCTFKHASSRLHILCICTTHVVYSYTYTKVILSSSVLYKVKYFIYHIYTIYILRIKIRKEIFA